MKVRSSTLQVSLLSKRKLFPGPKHHLAQALGRGERFVPPF